MGVMPRVRRDSVDERGIAMIDRKGRKTATMPADLFGGEGIVAEIEIMRGDLSRILYEATSGDVEYLFGDRIAGLTQDRDGVEVRFADGAVRRFYFDAICQVHVDRWARGRLVLVGDAGYCGSPLTGLGTSMSLVGAYVLAGELAATPHDHEAAFQRYQQEMRDYVAAGLKLPPGGVKGFAPNSQFMISMRSRSMRMMTRWPMRSLIAKQFQKSDGIVLN